MQLEKGAFQTCGVPHPWLWRESKKVLTTTTWNMGKQDFVLGRESKISERKSFFCEENSKYTIRIYTQISFKRKTSSQILSQLSALVFCVRIQDSEYPEEGLSP